MLGADSLRPGSQGRAMSGTGQSPAPRESPQLRERSGEVIVGYTGQALVPVPDQRNPDLSLFPRFRFSYLCRITLTAIRAVQCLAVASCAVFAGGFVTAVYDMPICGGVLYEHIGRRIMAVAVMHIC